MSERISKKLAKDIIERDIRLAIERTYSEKPNIKINCELALDIAIESLDNEQNIEQIKEKLLEKFKEHCYPVTQKDNSIEEGMTLTGITQVLNEVFSNIESLDYERKEQ